VSPETRYFGNDDEKNALAEGYDKGKESLFDKCARKKTRSKENKEKQSASKAGETRSSLNIPQAASRKSGHKMFVMHSLPDKGFRPLPSINRARREFDDEVPYILSMQ